MYYLNRGKKNNLTILFIIQTKLSKFFTKKSSDSNSDAGHSSEDTNKTLHIKQQEIFGKKEQQTEAVLSKLTSNYKKTENSVETKTVVKNESVESKVYTNLKKYFKYDNFKSETQKNAVLEIVKRKNDVYGNKMKHTILKYL